MQIKTPYSFTLDIIKPTKIPIMEFYQTDVNTSQMDISITNNDEVVDLTGHTLILNIKKADGTEIQNLATIEDSIKGLVNVSLTTQSLTALGECRVQLTVFSGETRKSTHEFKYYVKASLLNAEVPLSSNEYGLLLQLIDEVQTVENILNTSEAERVQAENQRIELANSMTTLKGEIQSLQLALIDLKDNVEGSEEERKQAELLRIRLKQELLLLQLDLIELQTELNDLNSTVNANEETRKSNEIQREANELDRIELKGQLDSLKGSLQSLENTLNANDATRTNTVNNKMYEVDNKVVNYEAIITDIQNRFALLSTSVQQASEVINARTSTIRNKTFVDLNSRIAEIEKDILTSQSTSVVDSVVPVNHLTNSLDGATDINIKGQTFANLLGNKGTSIIRQTGTPQTIRKLTGLNIQANKQYTLIFKITNYSGTTALKISDYTGGSVVKQLSSISANGLYKILVTSTTIMSDIWFLFSNNTDGICDTSEIMIIEGDYTNIETLYFEGISSVENTVIKSIGENLLNPIEFLANTTIATSPVGNEGLLGTNTGSRTSKKMRCKPNTSYTISGGNRNAWRFEDENGNKVGWANATTITTPSNARYMYVYYSLDGTHTQVMLNEGAVSKPYQAYKESKITLSDYIKAEYFPFRSVGSVVDEVLGNKLYKRLSKTILNGTESGWVLSDTSQTNTLRFEIVLPIQNKLYANGLGYLCDKFQLNQFAYTQDVESTQMSASTQGKLYIRISKTKCTDLTTFKTWLASNNVEINYELATPTETTLDRPLNIPIFKNGTIIQEPTKLYPKLSYSFPTNIGRSVESIVNNLAWIKDNQQFIMSYLLELDTRLTLGGH